MGFGVWGLGFGVWGLGFGVWGLGFGVWGLGFEVCGSWFLVQGSEIQGLGFWFGTRILVQKLGFWFWFWFGIGPSARWQYGVMVLHRGTSLVRKRHPLGTTLGP